MGWEAGRRFRREGTYVYLWLIHVDIWQKPAQYCKAIIFQLKINKFFKKSQGIHIGALINLVGWDGGEVRGRFKRGDICTPMADPC